MQFVAAKCFKMQGFASAELSWPLYQIQVVNLKRKTQIAFPLMFETENR